MLKALMLHVLFSCKWECEWEGDKTQQMFKTNLYGANQNPIIFCASIIFFYLKKVFDFKFIINDFSVINTHTLLKHIFKNYNIDSCQRSRRESI